MTVAPQDQDDPRDDRDTLAAQRAMEQHINLSGRHAVNVLEGMGFFDSESA